MDLLKDFSGPEIAELSAEFSEWNGDPENYEEDRILRAGMTSVGSFLFAKLMAKLEAVA